MSRLLASEAPSAIKSLRRLSRPNVANEPRAVALRRRVDVYELIRTVIIAPWNLFPNELPTVALADRMRNGCLKGKAARN
jgi:hypothetical protein